MFEFHSHNIITFPSDSSNQEINSTLPENTSLLFIDDDYVNYLFFNDLLNNTDLKINKAASVSQALYKLKFESGIGIIFISAAFAEVYNYTIIRYLKKWYSTIPLVTVIENASYISQIKSSVKECEYFIDMHMDRNHLIETIAEIIASTPIINHSQYQW